MKRLIVLCVVTLGVLAGPWTALATLDLLDFQAAVQLLRAVDPSIDPPPADEHSDFVVGGFRDALGENVGLSAHSRPTGQDVKGHESITNPQQFKARGRVVCLALSGKNAAWGWIVDDSNPNTSPLPGTEFVEAAKDGGPGGALDLWNVVAQGPPGSGVAATCGAAVLDAVTPILSGNILVNDAP